MGLMKYYIALHADLESAEERFVGIAISSSKNAFAQFGAYSIYLDRLTALMAIGNGALSWDDFNRFTTSNPFWDTSIFTVGYQLVSYDASQLNEIEAEARAANDAWGNLTVTGQEGFTFDPNGTTCFSRYIEPLPINLPALGIDIYIRILLNKLQ